MACNLLVRIFSISESLSCLSSCTCAGVSCVDSSNDELTEATDEHSIDKEDSAATPFGDDAAIDDDDNDSDGGQDAGILEWRSNLGHLEKVSSIRCRLSVVVLQGVRD